MSLLSTLPVSALVSRLFDADQFGVFGELQEPGDAAVIQEFVSDFAVDVERSLERLEAAIDEQDFAAITRLAHTLQGSFATFGMMRAHALAMEIEHLAELDRGGQLTALYQALRGAFAAGWRALRSHMERARAAA